MAHILNPSAAGDQSGVGSGAMLNPLNLALAPLRIVELLEEGSAQARELNRNADRVLAELAEAREVFAEAMLKMDRLSDQGDRVLAQLADAEQSVERLLGGRDDLVEAANAARRQLRESQETLAEANERFGRALEMAEPLDRMTTRAARIADRLRPGDGGGS
jgi:chromosome segregation ATPase